MLLQGALLALTAHEPMDFDTAEIRSPIKELKLTLKSASAPFLTRS